MKSKLFLLFLLLKMTTSLKCHQCQKDGDGKCHQKDDVGKPKDCSDKSFCVVAKHEHMNDTHCKFISKNETETTFVSMNF